MAKKRKQKKQKQPMYYPQTCGEVFHRHIVPAVNALLQFPDAHPLALQGMFNAVEMAYGCVRIGDGSGDASDWLRWLFPDADTETILLLSRQFVAPLRGTGFIAPGVGLAGHTRKGKPVTAPWRIKQGVIMVSPQALWQQVCTLCVEVFDDCDEPYTRLNKPWNPLAE